MWRDEQTKTRTQKDSSRNFKLKDPASMVQLAMSTKDFPNFETKPEF